LRYVMPGETPYMVELPSDGEAETGEQPDQNKTKDESWYELLWNAVSGE
jgi:hypothetical protein